MLLLITKLYYFLFSNNPINLKDKSNRNQKSMVLLGGPNPIQRTHFRRAYAVCDAAQWRQFLADNIGFPFLSLTSWCWIMSDTISPLTYKCTITAGAACGAPLSRLAPHCYMVAAPDTHCAVMKKSNLIILHIICRNAWVYLLNAEVTKNFF